MLRHRNISLPRVYYQPFESRSYIMTERFIESLFTKPDEPFDHSLRPKSLGDFVGQEKVCQQIDILIQAAKLRGEPLGHCLFSGPPGLGKTTLSYILAEALNTRLVVTSGPAIERPADLAIELSKMKEGEVLFIDARKLGTKHQNQKLAF